MKPPTAWKLFLTLILTAPATTFSQEAGKLDRSFGKNGYSFSNLLDGRNAIVMYDFLPLSDGSTYSLGDRVTTPFVSKQGMQVLKHKANGQRDSSFMDNGMHTFANEYDSIYKQPHQVLRQGNAGKILLVLKKRNGQDFIIRRLQPNGKDDSTFGINGKLHLGKLIENPAYIFGVYKAFVLSDDRILVTGVKQYTNYTTQPDLISYMLTPSGAFDTSYGTGGMTMPLKSRPNCTYIDVKIAPSDSIFYCMGNTDSIFFCKTSPSGVLNTSFGKSGYLMMDFNYQLYDTHSVIPDSSGRMIWISADDYGVFVVRRYKANGNVDSSFYNSGYYSGGSSSSNGAPAVIQLPEGGTMITFSSGNRVAIWRLKPNFRVDSTFRNDGSTFGAGSYKVFFQPPQQPGQTVSILNLHRLNESGRFYVNMADQNTGRWISRINYTSSSAGVDLSYGSQGYVQQEIPASIDFITGSGRLRDGKILILAKEIKYNPSVDSTQYLLRYLPNGTLDKNFGSGGILAFKRPFRLLHGEDGTNSLLVTSTDKILISYNDDASTIFFQQLNADGTPDVNFGINGTTSVPVSKVASVMKMVQQADDKILVLFRPGFGGARLIRLHYNGKHDTAFARGYFVRGELPVDVVVNGTDAVDMLYSSTHKIFVLGNGGGSSYTVAAFKPEGRPDSSFSTDGFFRTFYYDSQSATSMKEISTGIYGVYYYLKRDYDDSVDYVRFDPFAESSNYQTNFPGAQIPPIVLNNVKWNRFPVEAYVQNDKKVVLLCEIWLSRPALKFLFVRFNPDGKIDSLFGNNGYLMIDSFATRSVLSEYNAYSQFIKGLDDNLIVASNLEDKSWEDIGMFKILLKDIPTVVTGVNDIERTPGLTLKVSPNPVSSFVKLDLGESKPTTLFLYDHNGRLLRKFNCNQSSYTFDPTGLPAGKYFIKAITLKKERWGSFIKQ